MIDINDLDLANEFYDSTGDENYYAPPAPPDDGTHLVTLQLGRDGIASTRLKNEGETAENATGTAYLKVNVEGRPVEGTLAPGTPGFVLFDRINTLPRKTQPGSAVGGLFLVAAGKRMEGNLAQIKGELESLFFSKPAVRAVTQWQAQVKVGEGKYVTFLRGQNNFPKDGTGKAQHIVWVKIAQGVGGQDPQVMIVGADEPGAIEVRAQAKVVRYLRA